MSVQQFGAAIDRISVVSVVDEGRTGRVVIASDHLLRRRVVVKSLRSGSFESESARKRLIDEARVLSNLDHPNVLRIHDFAEKNGHDLITFEFADGTSLPAALENGLDFSDKLRIATAVASVLATAHRKGIVHGALSPRSVLIAEDGAIKVIDFLSTSTQLDGPRAGLQWQSPEQIRGERVTRASDMYAFGLLLRELFGNGDRDVRGLISSFLSEAATDRPTAAVALERLERLAQRRVRRIRNAAIAGAALFFLFAGAKYTVDLRRERGEALRAQREAEYRRKQANELVTLIIDDVYPKLEAIGRLDVMHAASSKAAGYYAMLGADTLSPLEAAANSEAITFIGKVQISRGDYDNGLRTLKQGIDLAEAAARRDSNNDELRVIAASAHASLAVALGKAGRYSEAIAEARIHARMIAGLARLNPRKFLREEGEVANHIGAFYDRLEDSARALPELERALSILQRVMSFEKTDKPLVLEVGIQYNKVGQVLLKSGRLNDAQARLDEGRVFIEAYLLNNQSDNGVYMLLAGIYESLASVAIAKGDLDAASRHVAHEYSITENLIRFEPGNVDWSRRMASALRAQAAVLRMRGEFDRALRSNARGIEILEAILARSKEMLLTRELADSEIEQARSWLAAGRPRAAAASADHAVEILEPIKDKIVAQRARANALLVQGRARAALGDAAGAAAAWGEALRVLLPLDAISQDPRITEAHASALMFLGRIEEAQPLLRELTAAGYRNPEFKFSANAEELTGNGKTKGA